MIQTQSPRAVALICLQKVHEGRSLTPVLDAALDKCVPQDKAFLHALVLETLRAWHALNRIGESLSHAPITCTLTQSALNLGLCQLLLMDTPAHAAIFETLEAYKRQGGRHVGLINALLRQVSAKAGAYTKTVKKNHSLPNYLARRLKQDWPDAYKMLGQRLRSSCAVFLRVNVRKISVLEYSAQLDRQGIAHSLIDLYGFGQCIRLDQGGRIDSLPGFDAGLVSVQDRHAQLAGHLIKRHLETHNASGALKVMDAACAPGGKTMQLLELLDVTRLLAFDISSHRLTRVHTNLARLQMHDVSKVQIQTQDATTYQEAGVFDVVLCDAPCTATGVISRHPDLTLLKQETDIDAICALQEAILDNLWVSVAKGGILLYVTCSLLKAENSEQIEAFCARHNDAQSIALKLPQMFHVKPDAHGCALLPNEAGGDGFYYALLHKVP